MPGLKYPLIEEFKVVLDGPPRTFSCERLAWSGSCAVVRYRLPRETVIEGHCMPKGTISYGYFWEQRHYNVYHFVDPQGQTLGLYFNVSDRTRITEQQIYWRDLTVDIMVGPDGGYQVLDEHELPEDLPKALRQLIFQVRDQIVARLAEIRAEVETSTARLQDKDKK